MDAEKHSNNSHHPHHQKENRLTLGLLPRKTAPGFTVKAVMPNNKFKKVSLDDYKGKYVVLLFYPFDFSYVCPSELHAFSDAVSHFKKLETEVLGISVDSHHTHLAWKRVARDQGGIADLDIPLLSDFAKNVSRSYGVLVEDEKDEMYSAALRGLFIIDGKQIVRSVTINDDQVGRSVDETLRLIEAFKYADEFGQVCPVNWKKGQATITPDQDKKQEFFEAQKNASK